MNILLSLLITTFASALSAFEGHYFVNDCVVHNLAGEIELTLPGQYCFFLDDGSFITHSESGIRFIESKKVKWQHQGHYHHHLSMSDDNKKVLLLGIEIRPKNSQLIKHDKFLILSRETGKILHSAVISDLVPESELMNHPLPGNWSQNYPSVKFESGHFNSFYEIPEVKERPALPWLKKGNYVVNSLFLGVFILSPDLKKVLHHFKYARSKDHQVHDVKVLPSGNFFLFNNVVDAGSILFSAIEEVDPETLKPVYTYGHETGHHFYASHRSGADIVSDDLISFSLQWQGAYVVSRKTGKVVISNNRVNIQNNNYLSTQHVRFLDLREFFRNWRK